MKPNRRSRQAGVSDSPRRLQKKISWSCRAVGGILVLAVFALLIGAYIAEKIGVPPRLLAPYIEKRTAGHNPTIVSAGALVASIMRVNDRGEPVVPQQFKFSLGAQPAPVTHPSKSQFESLVLVASAEEALAAIARAKPGDVITFAPGTYRFSGSHVGIARAGTAQRPIIVRATIPRTVTLEFDLVEGFKVTAPYWQFENLSIVGVCKFHDNCEHAFHVVGKGDHFVARNNTITDFNSHFKINAEDDIAPDDGLIETNTLTNSSVRKTGNPVDVIDLVVASRWVVRKNLITDFFKGGGNRTSYGGFAKGGGNHNLFENNLVICEYRVRSPGALSVGLSLGGGGTGAEFCRDRRCVIEQENSVIRGNLIASCSDDGIYLNKAAASKITHNTLIDTGGISVRFPSTSADIEGNLVDGKIRIRDGAVLRENDNMDTSIARLFIGSHPIRALFRGADSLDLTGRVPHRRRPFSDTPPDLCGSLSANTRNVMNTDTPPYGAFSDFSACLEK